MTGCCGAAQRWEWGLVRRKAGCALMGDATAPLASLPMGTYFWWVNRVLGLNLGQVELWLFLTRRPTLVLLDSCIHPPVEGAKPDPCSDAADSASPAIWCRQESSESPSLANSHSRNSEVSRSSSKWGLCVLQPF